jgi:hypothetical protein
VVEVLLSVLIALVAATAVLAALALIKLHRLAGPDLVTREAVAQLLRGETDLIRRAGDDQARQMREELATRIRDFGESTTGTFTALFQGVDTGWARSANASTAA